MMAISGLMKSVAYGAARWANSSNLCIMGSHTLAEPSLRCMPKSTSRAQSHCMVPELPAAKPKAHLRSVSGSPVSSS
jgi:hypothetical protein